MYFFKQGPICQKLINVCNICWAKIHIIYIYKNAFEILLKKLNQKLFKERMVSDIIGHPVFTFFAKLVALSTNNEMGFIP